MVEQTAIRAKKEHISYHQLPLAVYREIASHLRQVEGIEVDLVSQSSKEFDYNQSQIDGLSITYFLGLDGNSMSRIREILDYYAGHFGSYCVSPIVDVH
jgi:hypothetical protein